MLSINLPMIGGGGDVIPTMNVIPPSKPPGILVVEDQAAVLELLDVTLRQYGFDVKLAATVEAAVELYQQHYPSIDLVLVDVQMDGLDGPGTLAAFQKINPKVRCCFMSGHTGKYAAEELRAMGAVLVISKPFSSMDLLARSLWDMARGDKAGVIERNRGLLQGGLGVEEHRADSI